MAWIVSCSLLLILLLCPVRTQEPTGSPNDFTFLHPGSSYVEYRPQRYNVTQLSIEFSFRTLITNAVLLHHTLEQVTGQFRPQLWVKLKAGVLVVEHNYGDVTEKIQVAKGMSHDRWHKVRVSLSLEDKELKARVGERAEKSTGLKVLNDPQVLQAYLDTSTSSLLSVGGFSPDALQEPGTFVGCVRGLRVWNEVDVVDLEVYRESDVQPGCISACQPQSPCQNDGKCVNLYTSTECDCYKTGHHGSSCEIEGEATVTLTGGDWIRYNVYEDVENERSHLPGIRIAMDFRTSKPEGVLFYASETSPQYNHLAVSLYNGTLHVSVVFEDRDTHSELYTSIGKDLNDGRWHSLSLTHEGKDVKIRLDNSLEDMDAEQAHPHLSLPETVYFAGIEQGYPGIDKSKQIYAKSGLRSQETFLGCVRSLYFNHISVIDHIGGRATYHGVSPLEYKCQDIHTTSIQYQHDSSYIRILTEEQEKLDLEFEFRTYKPDTMLFHVDIRNYDYKGYIKGFLVGGRLELHTVPSSYHSDDREVITVGNKLQQAQWHNVKVFYKKGMTQVWVDEEFSIKVTQWEFTVGREVFFGYAPDVFDEKKSYIGCMKHIKVQGVGVDPLPLLESENAVGVSLGSCDLTDWCEQSNSCMFGGLCVSEWFSSYCDCSKTLYEGKHCQFSQLLRSCDEYYLSGERTSGIQRIDQDGPGPFQPSYVYCEMGVLVGKYKYGVTQIDHNLYPETRVRGGNLVDNRRELQYREMSRAMMKGLVQDSARCRQKMTINCYRAMLGLGTQTFFTSVQNKTFGRVGGSVDKACACREQRTCLDQQFKCNCDKRPDRWVTDSGYIEDSALLPITELTFLQEFGGKANISLGPLECMGRETQTEESTVMFTSPSSYVDLPGWRGGDMEFIFRTLKAPAVLVYQHGHNASHLDVQFTVELSSETSIQVISSLPPFSFVFNTSHKLNTGEWQHLHLEVSHDEIRASLAGERKISSLPPGVPGPKDFATRLYVGGKTIYYPGSTEGLVGCIGGLVYNGKSHKLSQFIHSKLDIYPGCQPQCETDPCDNGAHCAERWDSYQCLCRNVYAHSGNNCENNINENSVKFTSSDLHLYFLETFEILGEDYVFSFRTNQKRALLLYAYDHNNNYVQVDIEEGEVLHLSYNSGYKIQHARVKVQDLTNGLWKQVAIFSEQGHLILDVEGTKQTFADNRMPLLTYNQVPFEGAESLVPMREMHAPESGSRVYVGGVPQIFVGFEGLKGCVRGLKIGDVVLDVQGAGDGSKGFQPGCPSGCETQPCQNGGRCFDDVDFNDAYTCDCTSTGFADTNCDGEVGVNVRGDGEIEQTLQSARGGESFQARLELAFATSTHSLQNTAVAFVRGKSGLSDYMLIYLTGDKQLNLAADIQVQDKTVTLIDNVHAADGRPHRVLLERIGAKITFKVDDRRYEADLGIMVSHDPPAILDVAWVRSENFRFGDFQHFTGDIWNVFYTSDLLEVVNARPLEANQGYDDGNHGIISRGTLAPVSQSLTGLNSGYMYGDSTSNIWTNGNNRPKRFPPWNPGNAKTVLLVDPNAVEKSGTSPAVAFIVCGVALVFFLGLTFFLVLRHRRRKRKFTSNALDVDVEDEEEGLLNKLNPDAAADGAEEAIVTAKLRQGPKRPTSKQDAGEEENEETPMLQKEAPMAETALPGEQGVPMETFKQIREMPTSEDQLWWDSSYNEPVAAAKSSPEEEITGQDLEAPPPIPPKHLDPSPVKVVTVPTLGVVNDDPKTPSSIVNAEELDTAVPIMPEGTYDLDASSPPSSPLDTPTSLQNAPPKPPRSPGTDVASEDSNADLPGEVGSDGGGVSIESRVAESEPQSPESVEPEVSLQGKYDSEQATKGSGSVDNGQMSPSQATNEDSGDESHKDIQIKAEVYNNTDSPPQTESADGGEPTNDVADVNLDEDEEEITEIDQGSSVDGTSVDTAPVAEKKARKGRKKKAKH